VSGGNGNRRCFEDASDQAIAAFVEEACDASAEGAAAAFMEQLHRNERFKGHVTASGRRELAEGWFLLVETRCGISKAERLPPDVFLAADADSATVALEIVALLKPSLIGLPGDVRVAAMIGALYRIVLASAADGMRATALEHTLHACVAVFGRDPEPGRSVQ
jgi:hypothetical protein